MSDLFLAQSMFLGAAIKHVLTGFVTTGQAVVARLAGTHPVSSIDLIA